MASQATIPECIWTQLWERKGIEMARFSKDGRSVFAVNTHNELERIGAVDGVTVSKSESERRIAPDAGFPASAEVGPDGSFVVSGKHQADERRVRRVDFPGGKLVWEANQDLGRSLGVHVGAQKGMLGSLDICSPLGWRLRLYNDRSGDLVASHAFLTKPDDDFRAYRRMAFSQRGVAIAFKSRVLVWQTGERMKPVARLGGHGGVVALDGKLVLKMSTNPGSLDLTVANRNRDPLGGVGFQGWTAAAISMDASGGRVGLRGHTQAAAYRLNEKGIETIWELKNLRQGEGGFAVHPTEDRLWMTDKVLEFSSGRKLTTLKVGNLNFSATERTDPKSWSRSGGWVGSKHVVATMLQGSQGEAVSDAEGNQWLALWNSETGEMEAKTATPRLASLGISPDGQWIAEGGRDKRVRIRRGRDLGVEHEMRVHDEEVRSVVWHPTLPLFITSAKGMVRIWSSQTWRKVEELRLNGVVQSLQVVSAGRELGVDTGGGVSLYEPESFRAAAAP